MKGDEIDPKALIREAFVIEGIVIEECRAIFLDWALGVPIDANIQDRIRHLLLQYKGAPADHPMNEVLQQGLLGAAPKGRKGGRRRKIIP